MTWRTRISTLEQSPERRRYGCDRLLAGDRAVTQQDAEVQRDIPSASPAAGTADLRCARQLRCKMQQGECAVAKGKRTFQPNNRRRARVHGFRLRMRTRAGRAIVSGRRRKGRRSLTA